MAQTLYAYTRIRHGVRDDKGEVKRFVFEPGDKIEGLPAGDETKEVIKSWVESGSVATYNRLEVEGAPTTSDADLRAELADKDAEIERLRAELEAKQSGGGQK